MASSRGEAASTALSDPGPAGASAEYSARVSKGGAGTAKLPKSHLCAYRGDLSGLLACITDGHSIQETIALRNQHGRLVCGITPLFLASQRGHYDAARLLVDNGANPVQPCFIQGTDEICTPAEVASLNLHFKLARYLKSATKARRKEEAVLALDEGDEDRASRISSRLTKEMARASSVRSSRQGFAAALGLGRQSRGVASTTGAPECAAAEPEAQIAAANFIQNYDLTAFDPESGEPAVAQPRPANGVKQLFNKLFSRDKGFQPSPSHPVANAPTSSSALGRTSQQQQQQAQAQAQAMDPLAAYDPDRPDHKRVMMRFLKDLDLAAWDPQHEGRPDTRGPSPARASRNISPKRSARTSPARSRAGA